MTEPRKTDDISIDVDGDVERSTVHPIICRRCLKYATDAHYTRSTR